MPTTAPSVRRAAPSAPAPLSYKTSGSSSATTSSSGVGGSAPRILVLDSSSPAKPPFSSRNGAQKRGPLPPPAAAPPKRSYLDYDEGESVTRIEPRGPADAASVPLSSSPLASGSGYFPRPEKRPGQSSLSKSRLGSGASVIPLRLGADGKVTDDLDDDDDDEDEALLGTSAFKRLGEATSSSASSIAPSRKLVRHNSGLSSRQSSPGSQASTSTAANLAAQFSDAFIDQDEPTITRFANMFPAVSRSRVVEVLEKSGWEASIATDILLGFSSALPNSHDVDSDAAVDGFEIEEVSAKSKGVSAIYAKRRISDLDGRSQKKKKRRHGNASDSGSGDDYGDDGTSRRKSGLQKWERDEDQEEEEALVRSSLLCVVPACHLVADWHCCPPPPPTSQVWFNTCTPEELLAITSCSALQASSIVSLRPFESTDDLRAKLTKKKGVSPRLFDGYIEVMQGYHEVDAVLKGCEKVGRELERAMSAFMQLKGEEDETHAGELSVVNVDINVEQKLAEETDELRREALKGYLKEQPSSMAEGVQLKDYQVGPTFRNFFRCAERERSFSCSASIGSTCSSIAACRASWPTKWVRPPESALSHATDTNRLSCCLSRSRQDYPGHRLSRARQGAGLSRPSPHHCPVRLCQDPLSRGIQLSQNGFSSHSITQVLNARELGSRVCPLLPDARGPDLLWLPGRAV